VVWLYPGRSAHGSLEPTQGWEKAMVVLVVLLGLLVFAGYAGVTGRFAADSRDPEFRLSSRDLQPAQQQTHGAGQLSTQPRGRQVSGRPVVERTEVDVEDGPADLGGVCLRRELAG
jgi:hypothetical protein